MMMEEKSGVQAVSFTRVLSLVLFISALVMWYGAGFGKADTMVPDSMLYTLWSLLGMKGAKDVATAFKSS